MPTMFTVPWRWTRTARPAQTVVFVSRFDARGARARLALLGAGIRLRGAVLAAPGALGVSLRAHPFGGRYYTLSMWEDEEALLAFAHGPDHRVAVKRIAALGPVSGVLISREDGSTRPRWREVLRWADGVEPGPYRMASATSEPGTVRS